MSKHSNTENPTEHWDLILKPKAALFDLQLKEVWKYRDLLVLFVKRDFVAQYKQTILGPLWHFIQPIFTTIVFLLVFGKIANIPTDGINPVLFYMSGISIWNYFSACLTATSNTFVANAGIFGKVYFPRLVIPLSTVLSNIVKFVIQFFLLLAVMSWYGIKTGHFYFGVSWLLIPLLVLMMAGLGLGLGIIISSLTTKYRDFSVLIGFAVQLLMYATPVAYPLSYLSGKSFAAWISWNPLTPIVEAFRFALFGTGSAYGTGLVYSGGVIALLLFLGLLVFSKVERTFMDTV
ncbi:ABC transporter permease [Ferruginibacter paludis]|uniref:ABC transporter permease n=1 Tax=Ferruginibacter paludis TaxID=1310417 RepID=UPI0025B2BF8B|nr:ABC transporter permease [Ferruginibacter paludis]MDN3655881.1 ABC transporter permease [Ferruginibacter paludis]